MTGRAEPIAVMGDGQMGLFCAALLAQKPEAGPISLWGRFEADVHRLVQSRQSPRLPGLTIPDNVRITSSSREALHGARVVVAATPTQFLREVWAAAAKGLDGPAMFVCVSKGIETGTLKRPSEILEEAVGARARSVVALSGPTIASELARGLPAAMIAASRDAEAALRTQMLFTTDYLRVYTGSDVVGVELAGAVKNVIAIAAGILDGVRAGTNAKSALLARGLAEIVRLGTAMGAKPETFFGIAGVGDLATTCFNPEGRNRSCGEALGRGETLEHYLSRTASVVEGVATAKGVMQLARRHGVEMPICNAVNAVLHEGANVLDAIAGLMSRAPKEERVG